MENVITKQRFLLKKVYQITAVSVLLWSCASKPLPVLQKAPEFSVPKDFANVFDVQTTPENAAPLAATDKKSKKRKGSLEEGKKMSKESQKQTTSKTALLRRSGNDPIWVGEKIILDVTWLGTKAGEFVLEVLPHKYINSRKVYNLKGVARTTDIFAMIYRAEDTVESFVDYDALFPYKFTLIGNESKHIRNHLELYNHDQKKQYIQIVDNQIKTGQIKEDKGFRDLKPLSQDAFSALYYLRTQKIEVGQVVHFPMTTTGKQWDMEAHVIGIEDVRTKLGSLQAFKIKIETRFNGVIQQKGDSYIWVTNDDRKFPIKFEAKVRVGYIAGVAKEITAGIRPGSKDHLETVIPQTSSELGIGSKIEEERKKHFGETVNPPPVAAEKPDPTPDKKSGVSKQELSQEKRAERSRNRHVQWFRGVWNSFEDSMEKIKSKVLTTQ